MDIKLLLIQVRDFKEEAYLVDEMGGVDKLAGSEYPSAGAFWEYVREQLVVLLRQKHLFPTKVLLGGKNATNREFLRVLKDVLQDIWFQDPNLNEYKEVDVGFLVDGDLDIDPTFAAARRAALYARWRQEAPFHYVERHECEEERQHEREGKSPRVIYDELWTCVLKQMEAMRNVPGGHVFRSNSIIQTSRFNDHENTQKYRQRNRNAFLSQTKETIT